MTRAKSSTLEAGFCGWDLPGAAAIHAGVPCKTEATLGHVRGRDLADTSYREAMTKETPGGME